MRIWNGFTYFRSWLVLALRISMTTRKGWCIDRAGTKKRCNILWSNPGTVECLRIIINKWWRRSIFGYVFLIHFQSGCSRGWIIASWIDICPNWTSESERQRPSQWSALRFTACVGFIWSDKDQRICELEDGAACKTVKYSIRKLKIPKKERKKERKANQTWDFLFIRIILKIITGTSQSTGSRWRCMISRTGWMKCNETGRSTFACWSFSQTFRTE
jgi:hypothetical protein